MPVKVLFVTASISTRVGGSIQSVLALARAISGACEVQIWTTDHDVEHADANILKTFDVRVFPGTYGDFFGSLRMLRAMASASSEWDAVNVFHFWTVPGLFGSVAFWRPECPVFLHSQGVFLPVALAHHRCRKRAARALGGRLLLARYSCVIACNQIEIAAVRQWGFRGPIRILPNCVVPVRATPGLLRNRLGFTEDVRIVAYLNRFHPIKRVIELCQAFRIVQDRRKDVAFVLGGDTEVPYGLEVKAYAASVGLRAQFLGHLGPQEKWQLLADADVLCQYSAQEGHSNALIEALAAGTPVVASRGCHFEEIGTGGAGFVVDSIEELADATTRLLADGDLRRRMSANALRLGQSYYPEVIAATYTRILAEEAHPPTRRPN